MREVAHRTSVLGLLLLAAACSQPVVDAPHGKQPPTFGTAASESLTGEAGRVTADVGRDVEVVRAAEGYVQRLTSLLEDVQTLRAQGSATVTDVAQVQARLAQAQARLAVARGNLARSRARFKAVVGQPAPGEDP